MSKWLKIDWYQKRTSLRFNLNRLDFIGEKDLEEGKRLFTFSFDKHLVEVITIPDKYGLLSTEFYDEYRNIMNNGLSLLPYKGIIDRIFIDKEEIKDWLLE